MNEGLRKIGERSFAKTAVVEFEFPASLAEVAGAAFQECSALKTVFLADGCGVDVRYCLGSSVAVGPARGTKLGGGLLWDARAMRDVRLSEGLEKIGAWWFYGCGVEKVFVPASVRAVGRYAFACCRALREVEFATASALERIEAYAFCGSGARELAFPSTLA